MQKQVTWWQAIIAIVVVVLVVGGASYWWFSRKQVAAKYQPEGTPETYEQMQQMPAAGGAPMSPEITGEQPGGQ